MKKRIDLSHYVSWRKYNIGKVYTKWTSSFTCPQCKAGLENPDVLCFNLLIESCNNCGCVYVTWYK